MSKVPAPERDLAFQTGCEARKRSKQSTAQSARTLFHDIVDSQKVQGANTDEKDSGHGCAWGSCNRSGPECRAARATTIAAGGSRTTSGSLLAGARYQGPR